MESRQDYIYLDHAAATPLLESVRSAMEPYESAEFFNPSAPYAPAWNVRKAYEQARADLAHAIGARPAEVVITAGATESVNLAFSVLYGGEDAVQGHAVTTAIEHAAVLACARQHRHTLVPVESSGLVDPAEVAGAIEPDTRLVSIGLANNEIGTVQPLRAISREIAKVRAQRLAQGNTTPLYLHSDASQCAGQVDVSISTLGVDLLTLNAAKIGGPKQVGLLWVARSVQLAPLVHGGGQERGLRSGTENVAGAVGFACALRKAVSSRKEEAARLAQLRDSLQERLTDAFPDAVVLGSRKHRLPGNLNIAFPGIDAERVVYLLEEQQVYVGTGAACAANKATRSHVLEAIGVPPEVADGSLRLTLGSLSTSENTQRAAEAIIDTVGCEAKRARETAQRMGNESFWDTQPVPPKGLW